MKPIYFSLILALLSLSILHAQPDPPLPKGFTPEELERMDDYLQSRPAASRGIDTPPPFPVRTMAEWEEIQSLVIAWTGYPAILREIVRNAREECEVIIVCSNQAQVRNYLTSGGVSMDNVTLLVRSFNSVWMRDYGGNTVYSEDLDSLLLVDWIYNRPRFQDDLVPESVAELKGIPLYATTAAPNDLVHTGGNFMSDGFGTGFSSRLILEENSPSGFFNITNKNEMQIDQLMADFMGITRYPKMEELPYDLIHHIDMHMKLLDEETLIVGEYPDGVADGPQIEANLQYLLSNFPSVFGTPYKLIRVQMPPDAFDRYPDGNGHYRTFTNAVFVNKTLLVPIYEERYDTTALRIYREALPGYKVVGIDCNDIIPASGALHCITKAVGADDPLLISHQALRNTESTDDYSVNAYLRHASGIQSATLFYRNDVGTVFESVPMRQADPDNFNWTADIPGQPVGTRIQYYVEAEAVSGKKQVRPMPAPEGYWQFEVEGDVTSTRPLAQDLAQLGQVFPNPANAITCIPLSSSRPLNARISLVNMLGQEVELIHEGMIPKGESKYFFFANSYPAGSYFVRLQTEAGTAISKVVVH
ncbi:MAG: agmatine deiminase family protein [Bacteroidota bacterium]